MGSDLSDTLNKVLKFDDSKLSELEKLPEPGRTLMYSMLKRNRAARLRTASDGLNAFGINPTVYDLPKVEAPFFEKKINLLYVGVTLTVILLITLWFFAQNYMPLNISSDEPVKQTDSTNLISAPTDQIAENYEDPNQPANKEDFKTKPDEKAALLPGVMKVEVYPWAYVEIDGKDYGPTPLKEAVSLPSGRHTIKLVHPKFPVYERRLRIRPGAETNIKINFTEIVGYLDCKIEPWGEVYINNQHKGTTPLKPIALLPGDYLLTVTNASFGRREKRIKISEKETTTFELNFNSVIN